MITEPLIENAKFDWLSGLDYAIIFAPGDPAVLYLGPLPKFISCEIMTNDVKNPSETKT